jgi:hypothetical protein
MIRNHDDQRQEVLRQRHVLGHRAPPARTVGTFKEQLRLALIPESVARNWSEAEITSLIERVMDARESRE